MLSSNDRKKRHNHPLPPARSPFAPITINEKVAAITSVPIKKSTSGKAPQSSISDTSPTIKRHPLPARPSHDADPFRVLPPLAKDTSAARSQTNLTLYPTLYPTRATTSGQRYDAPEPLSQETISLGSSLQRMLAANPDLIPETVRDNDDNLNPPRLRPSHHYLPQLQQRERQVTHQRQHAQQYQQQAQQILQQPQQLPQQPQLVLQAPQQRLQQPQQPQQPQQSRQQSRYQPPPSANQPGPFSDNQQIPQHGVVTPAQIENLVRHYNFVVSERDAYIAHRDQLAGAHQELSKRYVTLSAQIEHEKDARVLAEQDKREAMQEIKRLQRRIVKLETKMKEGEENRKGEDEDEGRKRKKAKGKESAKEEDVAKEPAVLADAIISKGKKPAVPVDAPVDKGKKQSSKTEHVPSTRSSDKVLPSAPELTRISSAILHQHLTAAWPHFVTSSSAMATLGSWWSNVYSHPTTLTPRARLLFWNSIFDFWNKLLLNHSATLNSQGTLDAAAAIRVRAQANLKTAKKRQSLAAEGESMDIDAGDWYDLKDKVYHEGGHDEDAEEAKEMEKDLDVEGEEGGDVAQTGAGGFEACKQALAVESGPSVAQGVRWPWGQGGEGSKRGVASLTGGIEVDFPSVKTVNPALLKH